MAKSISPRRGGARKFRKIYLDYAAGAEANPSSIHTLGVEAKTKLEHARGEVARILSARESEIIFTSGSTESNNLAIQGIVLAWQGTVLPHIITTNIEHPSVLETFRLLGKRKIAKISIVPVEESGIVDPKKIKKEIKKNTVLVSVHYANNEIGTIQPIREIAKEIRHYKKQHQRYNIFFHTDAAQAANYLDLNVEKLGIDMLTLSGSKIEGAGKIGVLYKKRSVPLLSIFGGGNQEMGLRPGTENLAGIVEFAKVLKKISAKGGPASGWKATEVKRLTKLRDYFINKLMSKRHFDIDIKFNGDFKNRLPNNVNITIPNIPSDLLVIELSARGIMTSAKSACQAGDGKVSHVIQAINKSPQRRSTEEAEIKETDGSLRFSLGRQTTKSDIDYTVQALSKILTKLKKWY